MLRRVLTMSAVTGFVAVFALTTQLLTSLVQAQDESEPMATAASMVSTYEAIYAECHDNQGDQILASTREALRQMEPERVLIALMEGPMVEFTSEFRDDELRAMAELVTRKPFGGVAHREASAMPNQCARTMNLDNWEDQPSWNGWDPELGVHRFASEADGGILWEYPTRQGYEAVNEVPAFGGAIGATSPTIVGGMLYMGSGYGLFGGKRGNVLLAFGIEDSESLEELPNSSFFLRQVMI